MKWVVSGLNDSGQLVEPNCLMQELIKLRTEGFLVDIPTETGDRTTCTVKVFTANWSADWLAKQALLPFAESTAAEQCCSDCKWISLAARARLRKAATATEAAPTAAPSAARVRKRPETEAAQRKREMAQKLREAAAMGRAVAAKKRLELLPDDPLEAAGEPLLVARSQGVYKLIIDSIVTRA